MRNACAPLLLSVVIATCGWRIGRTFSKAAALSSQLSAFSSTGKTESRPPQIKNDTLPFAVAPLDGEATRILSVTTPKAQRQQLYLFADQLSSTEFPPLLGLLQKSGSDLYEELASFWFERDLPAARAWLRSLPSAERDKLFPAVLATWAKIDLQDVFAWLRELPEDDQNRIASINRNKLGSLLAKSDPEAAFAFLQTAPPTTEDNRNWSEAAEEVVFREWGKRDPQAASRHVNEVPVERRVRAAIGLVESWTEQSPSDVESWIATLNDAPLVREARKAYVSQRGERNPAAAAAYMLKNWIPQYAEDGQMSGVISNWIKQDERAALAWVKALPDPEGRDHGLNDILGSIDNLQRAVELWIAEFGDGKGLGWSSAPCIASGLAEKQGFDAAVDFVARVPQKDRKLVIEQFFSSEAQRTGADGITEAVLRRPQGPERLELIRPAFERLALDEQIAEARQLLGNVTGAAERQAAIAGLIEGELERNPDQAIRLAQSLVGAVEGPRLVGTELIRVYEPYKSELKEWVQKTPVLTPEEKERILNRRKNGSN